MQFLESEWFCHRPPNPERDRLRNVTRKILSVASPIVSYSICSTLNGAILQVLNGESADRAIIGVPRCRLPSDTVREIEHEILHIMLPAVAYPAPPEITTTAAVVTPRQGTALSAGQHG